MRILELTAQNIKKLRAVEITPDGNIVTIAGRNAQGKTSLLDSIYWLFAGKKGIQSQPVRRGEKSGKITAKLGGETVELHVSRTFDAEKDTTALTVTTPEGYTPPGGPQAVLDALIGDLSFDPLEFGRMDSDEQFEELRRVAKLEHLAELDQANAADYAKRTIINRDAKAKRAQAAAVIVRANLPAERADESALLNQLQKAGETNAEIETRKARRADVAADIDKLGIVAANARKAAEDLRRRADSSDQEAKDADARAAELTEKLNNAEPLPDPVDVKAIRTSIDAAKAINAEFTLRERRAEIEKEAAGLEANSAALTKAMAARDQQKLHAITKASLPVDGLGFGEGIVTLNGIPFDQASSSEQLRVSVAIAMAANPKLRVIRIKDGSLLDNDARLELARMAEAGDYQIWIEVVDNTGLVGFTIEDGAITHQEAAP